MLYYARQYSIVKDLVSALRKAQKESPHSLDACFRSLSFLVGLGRFELPTSPLSGVRSNQLSYRPLSGYAGGAERDRTDDLLNANQALSQLSYSPLYSAIPYRLGGWGCHPPNQPGIVSDLVEANWMFRAGQTVSANVTTKNNRVNKEAARVE